MLIGSAAFGQTRLRAFFQTVVIRRSSWHLSGFQEFPATDFRKPIRLQINVSENARQHGETEVARGGSKVRITQAGKQRSKWQKNAQAPPNAHAKSGADEKDSPDQSADQSYAKKNECRHGPILSTPDASLPSRPEVYRTIPSRSPECFPAINSWVNW